MHLCRCAVRDRTRRCYERARRAWSVPSTRASSSLTPWARHSLSRNAPKNTNTILNDVSQGSLQDGRHGHVVARMQARMHAFRKRVRDLALLRASFFAGMILIAARLGTHTKARTKQRASVVHCCALKLLFARERRTAGPPVSTVPRKRAAPAASCAAGPEIRRSRSLRQPPSVRWRSSERRRAHGADMFDVTWKRLLWITVYLVIILVQTSNAVGFYIPGVAPVDYPQGAALTIKTTKLVSSKSVLPYNYYSLPFCRPKKLKKYPENLGELLSGARIYSTPFEVRMLEDKTCAVLCRRRLRERDANILAQRIRQEYRVLLQLDNLPVGEPIYGEGQKIGIERGYPLGVADAAGTYLNNHLSFKIYYHRPSGGLKIPTKGYRIVGFEVAALSIQHSEAANSDSRKPNTTLLSTCSTATGPDVNAPRQVVEPGADVFYTYDVEFSESAVAWGSRWDIYLQQPPTASSIHWFSILNSSLIVVFLAATVFMILLRTLRQDLLRYNSAADGEEADEEEYGWKLVHGDVFRAPRNLNIFAVLVGSGAQLLGMLVVVLVIAMAGFLSPANRGGLVTAMVMLWLVMAFPGGYVAARIYKSYRGTMPKRVTLSTAILFPGICFATFFGLNLLLWMLQSSAAVPFVTLLYMFVLWFGISIPMAFLGSYLGYRKPAIDFPCRTNLIPRQIPQLPLYARTWVGMLVGGLLPFGSLFLSLFFILNSVLFQRYYYFFGFLTASFFILLLTTALNSMIFVYIRLSSEDWRWPWYSFMVSSSTGGYVFLYSVLYLWKKHEIDGETAISCLLFVVYAAIASSFIGVALGAVGFLAALGFVRRIYLSVKLD